MLMIRMQNVILHFGLLCLNTRIRTGIFLHHHPLRPRQIQELVLQWHRTRLQLRLELLTCPQGRHLLNREESLFALGGAFVFEEERSEGRIFIDEFFEELHGDVSRFELRVDAHVG